MLDIIDARCNYEDYLHVCLNKTGMPCLKNIYTYVVALLITYVSYYISKIK